ncbi:hypothetical protein Q7W82_02870 [Xanthomonas indica]|uniref:GIY-YIG domain-containing protein n=1 Tax=Xanthomonas indica TaxID=2912242 RepID=A0AAU8I788_9XANT|nr:hypothetical protein [Xanthomonas indica]
MAIKKRKNSKKPSTKQLTQKVWSGVDWTVHYGNLKRGAGRPGKVSRLFKYLGEKIPYESLDDVRKHFVSDGTPAQGVYIAHDSMGTPRYIGRGNVFKRLSDRKKAHMLELVYFSFYIVEDKQHEREIETLLIRAAGDQLEFNDRKKRIGIHPGNVRDYEPGTAFYERQYKKGRRSKE